MIRYDRQDVKTGHGDFPLKTNIYAKVTGGLQRILNVYRVIHNFMRVYFTAKEVPAVTLGVIDRRLSVEEIFHLQIARVILPLVINADMQLFPRCALLLAVVVYMPFALTTDLEPTTIDDDADKVFRMSIRAFVGFSHGVHR